MFISRSASVSTGDEASCDSVDATDAVDTVDARVRAAQRTNNLDAYTEWFNHLSYLVATTICKVRAFRILNFLISVTVFLQTTVIPDPQQVA